MEARRMYTEAIRRQLADLAAANNVFETAPPGKADGICFPPKSIALTHPSSQVMPSQIHGGTYHGLPFEPCLAQNCLPNGHRDHGALSGCANGRTRTQNAQDCPMGWNP